MLLQHSEKSRNLLGFVVAIDSCFLDEFIQPGLGDGFGPKILRSFVCSAFSHILSKKPVQDIYQAAAFQGDFTKYFICGC